MAPQKNKPSVAAKKSNKATKPAPVLPSKEKPASTAERGVVSFEDDAAQKKRNKPLSKGEKQAQRREQNKAWYSLLRRREEADGKAAAEDVEEEEQVDEQDTVPSKATVDLNPRHTQYYQAQLASLWREKDGEWERFVQAMKRELPMTFRLSDRLSAPLIAQLTNKLETHFKRVKGRFVTFKGEPLVGDLLKAVPWLPLTFELAVDNHTLSHEPSLKELHNFISTEVELGHIVRQELVSMVPALLLDLHHSHAVLDCCAAPGSKTEQILSLMARSWKNEQKDSSPVAMQGFLMANDADPKRIETLTARFSKTFSPHLVFSCMDGERLSTFFPDNSTDREKFDRIVCDVPCSGDGTFRKCPHLWRLFRPRVAIDFHTVQLKILKEALKVLKPGGKLVYSTCSLNPIEDEAVVAAALRRYAGHVRLAEIDVSQVLPGLVYRPGLSEWRVDGEVFLLGEDEKSRTASLARLPKLPKSLSPPLNESERSNLALHRCLRILPQDQNTGGFFIAVIEKTSSIPFEPFREKKADNPVDADQKKTNSLQVQTKSSVHPSLSGASKREKKSLQAMSELGYNPKRVESSSLTAFGPSLISLSKCAEFPTLRWFKSLDWREEMVQLERGELDSKKTPLCFVQRAPMVHVGEKESSAVQWEKDEQAIDPSELLLLASSAFEALSQWARSVPILHFGAFVSTSAVVQKAQQSHSLVLNPYAQSVVFNDLLRKENNNVCHASIGAQDMRQLLKLCAVKIQADINPFAKETKKTVAVDYFEDMDGDRAAFVQHPGLAAAELLSFAPASMEALHTALHGIDDKYRERFFLVLSMSLSEETTETDKSNNPSSALGKRRLSKAEKKKLAKQKTSANTSVTASTDEKEKEPENESQGRDSNDLSGSPVSLLFVCNKTSSPEETTMSFTAHWTLLTSGDLYESALSIIS